MTLFGNFVSRLTGKPANPGTAEVTAFFASLDKLQPGLASATARYVMAGEGGSVLSTLSQPATRAHWTGQPRSYPRKTPAVALIAADAVPALVRLGEALAALEPAPAVARWYAFGTAASPDWLRHALSTGDPQHKGAFCTIDLIARVAEAGGARPAPVVLDLLFHPGPGVEWSVNNSLDRFAGAEAWLGEQPAAVVAAAGALDAPGRVELLRAIGRFGLTVAYLPLLIEAGLASAKTVRGAAATALTGADPAALTAALDERYAAAAPAARAALVQLATDSLGAGAAPLLARWRKGETDKRPREALDRALATLALDRAPVEADAGPGYRAADGSFVTISPAPFLSQPSPIPADLFALLQNAVNSYNARIAALRQAHRDEKRHWTTHLNPLASRDVTQWRATLEGAASVTLDQRRTDPLTAIHWPQPHIKADLSGAVAFYAHPAVTMRHVIAIIKRSAAWSFLAIISGDSEHLVAQELRRRVRTGEDFRIAAALWTEMGGKPPAVEYLEQSWGASLADLDPALVWEHVAEQFDAIDEALGLRPRGQGPERHAGNALDLLGMLPRTPQRYLLPLLGLATGAARGLRTQARALLADAPDIDGLIAGLLTDGRQDVRAGAADWLAARGATTAIPALRSALARERSDPARAALITACAKLGDDVSDCFDPSALAAEATKGLAKAGGKGLDWFPFDGLPALRWRDGAPVASDIVRWWVVLANKLKQPGGNALLDLWLDRVDAADARALGTFVLRSWLHHDTARPSDDEANAFAAAQVDAQLAQNRRMVAQHPQYAAYYITDRDLLFAQFKRAKASEYLGSASDHRGMLALATRATGADAAAAARGFLKEHGQRIAQAKALLDTLAANPAPPAIQVVLGVAERFKARSVQEHAAGLVAGVAERNGWTPAELADRTVPTAGLDARGEAALDCGDGRFYRLRLDADDALLLLGPSGKPTKALPTARTDDEMPLLAAARKQLATARKEVKQAFAAQTDRLYEAMCVERRWPLDDWRLHLLGHPVTGRLLQRLVWIGHAGKARTAFRPTEDGGFTDAADAAVDADGFETVQLAHAGLLPTAEAQAWRTHLADYEVRQPFAQFAPDLPDLAALDARATAVADRHGWMIESFRLRGAAAKLGFARAAAADGGFFTGYERRYDAVGLVARVSFSGSPLPEENIAAALHDLTFARTRRGGLGHAAVPMGEVPPVLLAESWRALHVMAAAGTGFDPDWEKKAAW